MSKRNVPRRRFGRTLSKEERDFMETARARFKQGTDADEKQRERELLALSFAAGEQWPADIVTVRQGNDGSNGQPKAPARPMLTINQTLEPLNQLLAQMSAADLGFELVPADDFGDLVGDVDETEIKVREGLARRIQRDSQAIEARLWGADRGNICGRGYWVVLTRYVEGKSFDQEVYVGKIYNQSSVTLDPNREHFDGSDAGWGFVGHDMPWDEYVAQFGDIDGKRNAIASATDTEFRALGEDYPTWFTEDEKTKTKSCRVVDYYHVVREPRELLQLADGTTVWDDEAPDDADVVDSRSVVTRKVMWAKIDGYQRLDETELTTPYVPIVEYIARPIQPYDGERRYQGIVEPMIDSGRGFNYMVSRWVETIGLAPLRSIMMAEGQDEGFETEWQSINTRTGIAHYRQTDLMGRPAPPPGVPPQGNDVIGPISGAVQVFKDAIAQTTQSHGPSQGEADPALRSAKAIAAVVANDQRGDSTLINNWARSIRQEGRIINSMLFAIYGARPGRLASLIDPNGQPEMVMLNKPFTMQGTGKFARPIPAADGDANAKKFTLTDTNFNVVVKVTKNYETLRQEEAEILGQIIAADPESMMPVYGDLYFRKLDSAGKDEMADRAKIMLNQQVQQFLAAKAQGIDVPPAVMAHIQQLQAELQKAQGIVGQAQHVIETDQIKADNDYKKAKLAADKDILIHQMDNAARIEVARIGAAKQPADTGAEGQEEFLAAGLQIDADRAQSEQEHAQDKDLATHQAMLDAGASAQDHRQALEQGSQQVAGQMATAQQQAALQPPPAEGGNA